LNYGFSAQTSRKGLIITAIIPFAKDNKYIQGEFKLNSPVWSFGSYEFKLFGCGPEGYNRPPVYFRLDI